MYRLQLDQSTIAGIVLHIHFCKDCITMDMTVSEIFPLSFVQSMSHMVWDEALMHTILSAAETIVNDICCFGISRRFCFLKIDIYEKFDCNVNGDHAGTYVFKSRRLCRMERRSGSKLIPMMANQSMNQAWASWGWRKRAKIIWQVCEAIRNQCQFEVIKIIANLMSNGKWLAICQGVGNARVRL